MNTIRLLMGKPRISWLVLSLLTAELVIGCSLGIGDEVVNNNHEQTSAPSLTSQCRMIKHDLGETEICGEPQKIVVLSLHTLGLLLALDRQPTGCTMTLNVHPGEVFDNPSQQIPYLGDRLTGQPVNLGGDHSPSLEKLVALKPDLIIGEGGRNADEYEVLSKIAPTLLWYRGGAGQWQRSLRDIATALGQPQQAEDVIDQYQSSITKAKAEFAEVTDTYPKLLLLGANRLDEGVLPIESEGFLAEVVTGVGFQLVSPTESGANAPISLEALPNFDEADSIIMLGYNFDVSTGLNTADSISEQSIGARLEKHQVQNIQQDWETSAIAQSLQASQVNRVYFATFYKWGGLSGPIGAEFVLEQLRQFLLSDE